MPRRVRNGPPGLWVLNEGILVSHLRTSTNAGGWTVETDGVEYGVIAVDTPKKILALEWKLIRFRSGCATAGACGTSGSLAEQRLRPRTNKRP